MALIKAVSLSNGLSPDYQRVTAFQIKLDQNRATVTIGVYASKAARAASKDAVFYKDFEIDVPNAKVGSISLAGVYTLLKTLPDFTGATDDVNE